MGWGGSCSIYRCTLTRLRLCRSLSSAVAGGCVAARVGWVGRAGGGGEEGGPCRAEGETGQEGSLSIGEDLKGGQGRRSGEEVRGGSFGQKSWGKGVREGEVEERKGVLG